MSRPMRYSGFISYSRQDGALAAALERRLESWRPPRDIRRQTGIDRFQLFRDVQDASLGELSEVLRTALMASDTLIVLCSPASRASAYVGMEIEAFAAHRGAEAILPVLVDGRPNAEVTPGDPVQDQAFPDALLALYGEPLAADLRPHPGESRRAARIRDREAFFQIVAKLLGIPKSDELVQRDRRTRRLRLAAIAVAALLAIGGAGVAWWDLRPKAGLDPVWRLTAPASAPAMADGLTRLSDALDGDLPAKRPDDRLLIATWNIRDFWVRPSGRIVRGPDDFTAIADVVSRFDIVAVQEMKGYEPTFGPARDAVLDRLGRHWAYVGSGVTEGPSGNRERLGFFYDTRAVTLGGAIDEMVLSPNVMEAVELDRQIARTPVIADFAFAGRQVKIANAHIIFGRSMEDRTGERAREFEAILTMLRSIGEREDALTVMMGDLNFHRPDIPQADIAPTLGFRFPPGLLEAGTSIARSNRPYAQIVLGWPQGKAPRLSASGVFRVVDHVYRDADFPLFHDRVAALLPDAPDRRERFYATQFRSRLISDHSPKWIELVFDPD